MRKVSLISAESLCLLLIMLALLTHAAYGFDADNIVGAWLLDGTGQEIVDSSGNGLHGQITLGVPKRVKGVFGGAIQFASLERYGTHIHCVLSVHYRLDVFHPA